MADVFAVTLKADGGGTATVLCRQLVQDPLFPGKVAMVGIIGVSWPVLERYLLVGQWSVDKGSVLSWMVGPMRMTPDIDFSGLVNGEQPVPILAGSQPNQVLMSHPELLEAVPTAEDEPEKADEA